MCEMCDLARPEPAPLPVNLSPPSPVRRVPALPLKPKELASEARDSCRQRHMKEDGLKLIQLIKASVILSYFFMNLNSMVCLCSNEFSMCQEGEKKGMSPEEVYMSIRVTGDRSSLPSKWLKMELPLLLDQIRTLVAASGKNTREPTVSISLELNVSLVHDYCSIQSEIIHIFA